MAVVYSIKQRASGREYIGMTSNDVEQRWMQHVAASRRGSPYPVHCALRKYGPERFHFRVIASVPTFQEAQIAEMLAIAVRNPAYNCTNGGDGLRGLRHRAETRAKMSASAKDRGQRPSPQATTKGAAAAADKLRGVPLSPARRDAMSQAQRLRFGSTWTDTESRRLARNARQRELYWQNADSRRAYARQWQTRRRLKCQ